MRERTRYLSKLLFVMLLNICAIALAGRIDHNVGRVSALRGRFSGAEEKRIIQAVADSDYYLLARLIEAECPREPYTGQVAVGAVVLNRVRHSAFPDSIAGVVYQPGAFDSVADGRVDRPAGQLASRAARDAFNGLDPSGGAVYYYNAKKTESKQPADLTAVKIIGSRTFYRPA